MKRLLKNRLLNSAMIFTLSSIFNKGLNFIILPVLTHYLSRDDYGHLGFIVSVVAIASIYIGLWPSNFVMAKFSSYGKEKMSKYLFNIIIIIVATFFMVTGVMFLFEETLFTNFHNRDTLIVLISVYTLFLVIFNTFNTIVQLEKNALKYAMFQSLYLFSSLGLALLLIIVFGFDWRGKFYAELLILAFLAMYSLWYFVRAGYLVPDVSLHRLRELLAYLFPLTFFVVGLFLMGTIDKVILAKYMCIEAVGIYTIAMTMSIIVNIIYDAAIKAWEPHFFERVAAKTPENMNFIIKTVVLYSLFVVVGSAIYILLIPYVFHMMIDAKFSDSLHYIPLLVIGFSFEGLRKPLASFLMHKDKVKTLGTVTLLAALVNIVLNIILIPKYGIGGAAYATIGAFALLYIVTLFLVFRYCDIRWTRGS